MKKIVLALGLAMMAASSAYATGFTNGGFEAGDVSGWTGGGGTWHGSPVAPANPSIFNGGPSNNTIMSGGVDPITGANRVYSGNYSVRANDNISNYSVSTLRQTVTNYTDSAIYFAWNAVLQGSHGLTDSDYFSLTLTDDTTNTTIVNRAYSSAGAIGGGASGVNWTSFGSWLSSGWVVESINLADLNAIGHDFTLTLLASDCPYGGHAGYVYLDGFGARIPPNDVPEPGSLALLGLGIAGLASLRKRKNAA
ncbi:PEP-CTERM sorting domain-containing protein [Undibacterium sp. Rencai35W]|uniref:PEP-CTERM sorting domain-containing protein n=1 Tax=Undibacterium sp. Rencai35W TaxID=3413046 RepID=UPI003BF2FC64